MHTHGWMGEKFKAVILTRNIIIVISLDQQELEVLYNKE